MYTPEGMGTLFLPQKFLVVLLKPKISLLACDAFLRACLIFQCFDKQTPFNQFETNLGNSSRCEFGLLNPLFRYFGFRVGAVGFSRFGAAKL